MNVLFIPGRIKTKRLIKQNAGYAHGGHPIPLVYWEGLRCAWYHLQYGEILNKEGEKDPYPQAVLPLNGKGKLELNEDSIELNVNQIFYIPPDTIH